SRIERNKGIFVALEATRILNHQKPNSVQLTIAGKGTALSELEHLIQSKSLKNINMVGFVTGKEKHQSLIRI
ncbi:MAG: glycosyltransferase, partial [Bacteroidales bacterium]|nr:glycosyltransferase [Bacteroidales bacterium]